MKNNNYTLYFTLANKKMKITLSASNKAEAEYLLRGMIKIIKIDEIAQDNNSPFDFLTNIVNGKG
jgi:hypothetical protein